MTELQPGSLEQNTASNIFILNAEYANDSNISVDDNRLPYYEYTFPYLKTDSSGKIYHVSNLEYSHWIYAKVKIDNTTDSESGMILVDLTGLSPQLFNPETKRWKTRNGKNLNVKNLLTQIKNNTHPLVNFQPNNYPVKEVKSFYQYLTVLARTLLSIQAEQQLESKTITTTILNPTYSDSEQFFIEGDILVTNQAFNTLDFFTKLIKITIPSYTIKNDRFLSNLVFRKEVKVYKQVEDLSKLTEEQNLSFISNMSSFTDVNVNVLSTPTYYDKELYARYYEDFINYCKDIPEITNLRIRFCDVFVKGKNNPNTDPNIYNRKIINNDVKILKPFSYREFYMPDGKPPFDFDCNPDFFSKQEIDSCLYAGKAIRFHFTYKNKKALGNAFCYVINYEFLEESITNYFEGGLDAKDISHFKDFKYLFLQSPFCERLGGNSNEHVDGELLTFWTRPLEFRNWFYGPFVNWLINTGQLRPELGINNYYKKEQEVNRLHNLKIQKQKVTLMVEELTKDLAFAN
jgi:hypothetical protein